MPPDGATDLRTIIENAPDASAAFGPMTPMPDGTQKPMLTVLAGDLPQTARELRDLFAACGYLFDRGGPVRLVQPADGGPMIATSLTVNRVVIEAHRVCQPARSGADGKVFAATLPERVAKLYLDMNGDWNLPPLAGISTAPLLSDDGAIRDRVGYEPESGLWCCKVPPLSVPARCTRDDADAALRLLRDTFKTFPFADSLRRHDPAVGIDVVDLDAPPGRDESAFLVGLLTAVCRASLWLAPGFLLVAPQVSGAGNGKGLLARAICLIAFGVLPKAFTAGHDRQELDKRLATELVEGVSAVFLDNLNASLLRSDTLASALTERPARVRILGSTRTAMLNSTVFIIVTGNGLGVSEDLARRFILCNVDARCENPETRPFKAGFLKQIEQRRAELLSAALTIWRFGRQDPGQLCRGRPLGSFETWSEWVRDPLLTLRCCDPVEQIAAIKAQDPQRLRINELFETWYRCHGTASITAAGIHDEVRCIIDPQNRGRQYVAIAVQRLANTRAAGFVLTWQAPIGHWGAATYQLFPTPAEASGAAGHRDHRGHRADTGPMIPTPPVSDTSHAAEAAIVTGPGAAALPTAKAFTGWTGGGIDLNKGSDWHYGAKKRPRAAAQSASGSPSGSEGADPAAATTAEFDGATGAATALWRERV